MPFKNLPDAAFKIWEKVYEANKEKVGEQRAAKMAWGAVKQAGWKRSKDGKWTKKAELTEFSLAIKKAYYDEKTQAMRWRADASDIDDDSYTDNMSLELFADFLARIETKEPVPEQFRSDFWSGGMPYMSVSHFRDQNGNAVPGTVETVYIDGKFLKSKGTFHDTPLGRACFKALCEDMNGGEDKQKVRVSIAFLDYMHKHKGNGFIFERKSLHDFCPECIREMLENKYEGKTYLKGHLIHEALTRVPVNKRTSMEVELSMTTQTEDAASIIGDELAKELDDQEKALVGKSEALVTRADNKCPECGADMKDGECTKCGYSEDESKEKEEEKSEAVAPVPDAAPEIVAESESVPVEKCYADSPAVYYPYGGATSLQEAQDVLDAQQEAYRLSDLWNMVQAVMGNIFANDEVSDKSSAMDAVLDEFKAQVKAKADFYKQEAISARKDVNPKEGEKKYGNVAFADEKNKKYPIDTAEHIRAAWNYINKPKNAAKYSSDEVSQIKHKIIAAWKKTIDKEGPPSAKEKAEYEDSDLILDALDELKSMFAAPKGTAEPVMEKAAHILDEPFAIFKRDFDSVMLSDVSPDEKLRSLQGAFNEVANHIIEHVKSVAPAESTPAQATDLAQALSQAIAPMTQKLDLLITQLSTRTPVTSPAAVPAPRSLDPRLVQQAQLAPANSSPTPKLRALIDRTTQ